MKGLHVLTPVGAVQQPSHPVEVSHVQTLLLQLGPVPQTIPQPPQLLGSVASLTQALPHGVSPAGHTQLREVVLQVSPATVEQSVEFTKVPATHVCTASPAGEHRVVFGAHVPLQPVLATHV